VFEKFKFAIANTRLQARCSVAPVANVHKLAKVFLLFMCGEALFDLAKTIPSMSRSNSAQISGSS
jgi:hypothetical protein